MSTLLQDIRYAARTLRKNPGFGIIAVVCLALGIATNTTLFSCFNAMVLRPFPFADPDHLVALSDFNPRTGNRDAISYLNYLDWRDQSRSLQRHRRLYRSDYRHHGRPRAGSALR